MINLIINNEYGENISDSTFFALVKKAEIVLNERIVFLCNCKQMNVSLIFVNDEAIRKINCDHRGKDKPTDVISFAYLEGEGYTPDKAKNNTPVVFDLGDIFISIDTAKSQAKEKKHSLERELQILFVHGILHLLGFDHQNDDQEAEMEERAERILEA